MTVMVVGAVLSVNPLASADCGGPTLDVSERAVRAGDHLRIRGQSWGDSCNDTPGDGCSDPPPLGEPIEDITIFLQNETTRESFEVTTIDAEEDYTFEVVITVPDIPSGSYVVTDTPNKGGHSSTPLLVR
jgi:hypothetical protein